MAASDPRTDIPVATRAGLLAAGPMELPDVARIERLSLRPGDRLVLTVDHPLDDAEFSVLLERTRELARDLGLPEGGVIILDSGTSLQVLEGTA
jgi:hypothetical protein